MRETLFILLALAMGSAFADAQTSAALSDPLATFEEARLMFESDAYGPATLRFEDYLSQSKLPGTAQQYDERLQAELLRALAAQRAELPEAEPLLERFIDRYSPQPIAIAAIKQVADMAFAERDYARAAKFYERLPLNGLTREQRDEVRFRLGYTAFASKDFALATRYLGELRGQDGLYREPATYYYALTKFYSGDNQGAKEAFESLSGSQRYAAVLPGNLAQIYFADGEYERVIAYAEPLVDQQGVRQRDQIHLLIGRSYFELERYAEALPHLEFYAQGARKMSAADFYQLGYTQYKTNNFSAAAQNLANLDGEKTALGQAGLYYLGNSYLKLDDRAKARSAFTQVIRLDFDPTLKQEAAWNVAKLNYELGYDQDALEALQSIPPDSRHYQEAQVLLSRVILQSRDYAGALKVLDSLTTLTPALRETKQRVQVLRGLQLLSQGDATGAETLLAQSLTDASDAYYKAIAYYWLGDLAYRRGEMKTAIQRLNSFMTTARATSTTLPTEANPGTASYLLGYAHLKDEEYGLALGHFQEAVAAIKQRQRLMGDAQVLQAMLADAVVRAGDANFKRNEYASAARFYEEAIDNNYPGSVYALYQLAIIEGLQGDNTEKIIAMETIADDYPQSEFADEAMLELGITYQSINQLNRAKQALERLVNEKPKSTLRNEALLQLGLVSINQGNTQTSIDYYKQVFANQPKANEVRRAQAALQEIYVDDLGRPDDYFSFLETVPGFKLDASVRDSINFASAQGQYQSANYDRAIEQYSSYLAEFPKGAYASEAFYRRADAYLILQQFPEALSDFEQLIQRGEGPYYAEALEKAALLAYDAEQDFAKAYRYFSRLLETNSEQARDPATRLNAIRAAYRSKNTEAVYALAQPIIQAPNLPEKDKAIAGFYLGKVAYDQKDYDRALASFNAVIRNNEGEAAAEARYLVARIYYLRRELDLAEAIAIQAQRQSAGHPYWVAKSTLLLIDLFLEKEDFLSARAVAEGLVTNYRGDKDLEREAERKLKEVQRAADAASRVAPVDSTTIDLLEPDNN